MNTTTTVTITAPADALATSTGGSPPRSLVDDAAIGVGHLYLEYADRLLQRVRISLPPALAGRTDPEDVVQSVFRRLIARYGLDGYAVPGGHELWKLLLTIAMNKIRDEDSYHRALRRDVRRTRSANLHAIASQVEVEDTSLRMVIEDLIAPLPLDRRSAVELRLAGHDFKEIADKLGRSKRTIERYLQEFRDRLDVTLADTLN
jgi:RNA polymerase sigma-70 factor, ECF subfamily